MTSARFLCGVDGAFPLSFFFTSLSGMSSSVDADWLSVAITVSSSLLSSLGIGNVSTFNFHLIVLG